MSAIEVNLRFVLDKCLNDGRMKQRFRVLRFHGIASLGALSLWFSAAALAADTRAVPAVIDDYVRIGLESNLSLQSQSLEIERAEAALDAARASYFPSFELAARYTRAEGGRDISLPIAEAVNPIYTTLNELLAAQGQPQRFAQIANESFNFLRPREQDTRVSLRQPLFAPAIPAAVRAQRHLLGATEFARQALARRLKRDISVGYLDWLAATKAASIVESSVALLQENLRVNESLFRNGKVTQDQVLRARAELLAVEQQLRESRNGATQAQSFLNFLLNRPLDTPLEPSETVGELMVVTGDLAGMRAGALERRPELAQLTSTVRAAGEQLRIARSARLPTLSLGADAGFEGERYDFNRDNDFRTVSLLLNWTFFDGGARAAEVRRAAAGTRQSEVQMQLTAQQIQLEVQQAMDRLTTAADSLATAEARAEAARAGFRIASRKRDEGVINQVEFIDARSSLTGAELNLNVTRFAVLARQAELAYATAAGPLPLAVAGR
jgi:outer membrane protein TolC